MAPQTRPPILVHSFLNPTGPVKTPAIGLERMDQVRHSTQSRWGKRWKSSLHVVVIGGLLGGPVAGAAQQIPSDGLCTSGRIGGLTIDNRSIFDLERIGDRSFAWAFRLANRLHIKTRKSFIERELLFGEGDCYDPFLLSETERILRSYGFISQADVTSSLLPDGSHQVVIQTQDEWTTQVDLGVSFDGGLAIETLEVTEENFLGRGMELEFFLQERREMRDYGVRYRSNHLLGSRWDSRLTAGRTRVGDFYGIGVAYPFVGEVGLSRPMSFTSEVSIS